MEHRHDWTYSKFSASDKLKYRGKIYTSSCGKSIIWITGSKAAETIKFNFSIKDMFVGLEASKKYHILTQTDEEYVLQYWAIDDVVPESMKFGLLYASDYYAYAMDEDAAFKFTDSEGNSKTATAKAPLALIRDGSNDSEHFDLYIHIPKDLEFGKYKLEIDLPIAAEKEADDVRPYHITVDNFNYYNDPNFEFVGIEDYEDDIPISTNKTVKIKFNEEAVKSFDKFYLVQYNDENQSLDFAEYPLTSGEIVVPLDTTQRFQDLCIALGSNTDDGQFDYIDLFKSILYYSPHKLTFMSDGKVVSVMTVYAGAFLGRPDYPGEIDLPDAPLKEGYVFDGWEGLPEIMPDNDITVNARFIVEPPVASGKYADINAKWSLSKDGTLHISGTGSACLPDEGIESLDYLCDDEKRNMVKKVVVGEGITELGDYVLYELYNAGEITLPSTLEKIGAGFMKGSSVRNVIIPANVTSFNMDLSFVKCPDELEIYFMHKDIKLIIEAEYSQLPDNLNLWGYSGSEVYAYAAENNCVFNSLDPDFAINNGAESTTDKNVKISLNDYAKKDFTQYKINDGEYKSIDTNDIDFVLDNADGEKEMTITFKNNYFEIEKTHKIIYDNKHKITYVFDGQTIDEAVVGCGAKIAATDKTVEKEGYIFLKWDIPEIMPDMDLTVNAVFVKGADSETLNSLLTDEEKEAGYEVKMTVTTVDENENIQTAIINEYSKYTSAMMINIDIAKGKDEAFTPITETENLLNFTVDIPSDIKGKREYIVLREHNGEVDALRTRKNSDGEYIEVKDNTIIIHAKKFSAYMLLAKDADPKPSYSGGGGGVSSYTVKFETNGAEAIKQVSVKRNTAITAPAEPFKDGYVFDGWYTDKEFKTKFDFATKITKSMTLYAKWTEKAKTSIILTIGKKDADINGKIVANDVAPKIVNDRTMLPIRFIAEALGAKVEWFGETQTVKVSAEGIDISLVIGETFATVNGEKIDLDSPSFVENDRTYLPIRFVSEKLGAEVEWDEKTKTVKIVK